MTSSVVPCHAVAHEDVRIAIRITRHKVCGSRRKGNVAPVGAHGRGGRSAVFAGNSGRTDAYSLDLTGQAVTHIDTVRVEHIPRDHPEPGCRERHEAPVAAEGHVAPAASVKLLPAGADTHALGGPGLPIPHEDIGKAVRITRHEVGGVGGKCYDAPVIAERDNGRSVYVRRAVRLQLVRINTDALRGARPAVANEDVAPAVRVARHQVRSFRIERHVATVDADRSF